MNYMCSVRGKKQDIKTLQYIESYSVKIKNLERRKSKSIINIRFENNSYYVQWHVKGARVNYLAQSHHKKVNQAIKSAVNKICRQILKKRGIVVQARQSQAYKIRRQVSNSF